MVGLSSSVADSGVPGGSCRPSIGPKLTVMSASRRCLRTWSSRRRCRPRWPASSAAVRAHGASASASQAPAFSLPGIAPLPAAKLPTCRVHRLPPPGEKNGGSRNPGRERTLSGMSRPPPRLVIVDDHQMVLDGLRAMLAAYPGSVQIVGEACEPDDVIALVARGRARHRPARRAAARHQRAGPVRGDPAAAARLQGGLPDRLRRRAVPLPGAARSAPPASCSSGSAAPNWSST